MDRIDYDDLVIVCKAKSLEIERLKEQVNEWKEANSGLCDEIEWLINRVIESMGYIFKKTKMEARKGLIENMQKALKGEENKNNSGFSSSFITKYEKFKKQVRNPF